MAEGRSGIFKRLQSEVTCPLCLDIFTEPKKLPCDHVYCRACLHGLALRSRTGNIHCPECRREIPMPTNGVANFPTPHQVNRLLEMYQDSLKSAETEAATPKSATCEVHSSQPLALYCETCEKLVCSYCALITCAKQNHKHGFIDDMVKKYKEDLVKELDPVKKFCVKMKSALESIMNSERELLQMKESKLERVQTTFDALAEILEQERRFFTTSVEKSYQDQQKLYAIKKREVMNQLATIESAIQAVNSEQPKPTFLVTAANKKKTIKQCIMDVKTVNPIPEKLPEIDLHMCNSEEFRQFNYSKNFTVTKSDPLECHLDRATDLCNALVANKGMDITLHLNFQKLKKNIFGKFPLTVEFHCCSDNSSEIIAVKKIADGKYSLSLVPKNRGPHNLRILYNDVVVSQTPAFVKMPPPNQLKMLLFKRMDDVAGMKFYGGKIYATQAKRAINVLDPATLEVEDIIKVTGANESLIDPPCIYVTDVNKHRLVKMNTKGTILASTGTKGDGPGQFDFPNGIRFSKDNEIYVCDSNNHRIQVFDRDLNLLRILGRKGSSIGCFDGPDDLDFDDDGNIYVVEQDNRRVQALTSRGKHIRTIGRPGTNLGELVHPVSAAIHYGLMYVTDIHCKHVSVFKTTGEFVTTFGQGTLSRPECIAIDDNGYVYVSDNRCRIVKF